MGAHMKNLVLFCLLSATATGCVRVGQEVIASSPTGATIGNVSSLTGGLKRANELAQQECSRHQKTAEKRRDHDADGSVRFRCIP